MVNTSPVIGTILVGPYNTVKFLYNKDDVRIKKFFSVASVMRVVHGKRIYHKGCSFRHSTIEEINSQTVEFTEEIAKSIIDYIKNNGKVV